MSGCRTRAALRLCSKEQKFTTGVQKARDRFGRAFAHEPNSSYVHHHTPKILERWKANRSKA